MTTSSDFLAFTIMSGTAYLSPFTLAVFILPLNLTPELLKTHGKGPWPRDESAIRSFPGAVLAMTLQNLGNSQTMARFKGHGIVQSEVVVISSPVDHISEGGIRAVDKGGLLSLLLSSVLHGSI
jgi:hypothetical protein